MGKSTSELTISPTYGFTGADQGRFAITKKEEDRYVFRVPMLRNVAKTAPYFHDGSVERLDRAVRIMASVRLGRTLDDAAVADIVAFLESLTGEVPANYAPPGKKPEMQEALTLGPSPKGVRGAQALAAGIGALPPGGRGKARSTPIP